MANLTISVDEEVLKRARIRALEENSSVNAVLELAAEADAGSGGHAWKRDDLHER